MGQSLRLLSLGCVRLAGFVLAAAPPAPMSLQLHLAIDRCWPQFSLGLGRFCRHACTSWHSAIWCIVFLASAVVLPAAELPLPVACPDWDGEHDDRRSCHSRTLSRPPRSQAPHAVRQDSQKPCHLAAPLAETLEESPRPIGPSVRPNPGPFIETETARLALSSGNALPMGASAASAEKPMNGAAKLPRSAASALCPFRVARVSRLIGYFDSTAKTAGWQVYI